MTIDFTLTHQAQKLVDEVCDWSLTYGHPLARAGQARRDSALCCTLLRR